MKAAMAADGATGECQSSPLLAILLVLFAAGAVWTYVYFDRAERYDREYVGLLAEARFLSQRIVMFAGRLTSAGTGNAFDPSEKLYRAGARFERVLHQLRGGDTESGMPPVAPAVEGELHALEQLWEQTFVPNLRTIADNRESNTELRARVRQVNASTAGLLALSDQIATEMANRNSEAGQVYVASRQLMLSQRLATNVNRVLEGGEGAVTAADRFGRDAALFGRVVEGLLNGSPRLGIERVTEPGVRSKLEDVNARFMEIREHVGSILQRSPEMFMVNEAVREISGEADVLVGRIDGLEKAYLAHAAARGGSTAAIVFGVAALVLLLVIFVRLQRGNRVQPAGMGGAGVFVSPPSHGKDPNFYR